MNRIIIKQNKIMNKLSKSDQLRLKLLQVIKMKMQKKPTAGSIPVISRLD